jgi:hypothetical protein
MMNLSDDDIEFMSRVRTVIKQYQEIGIQAMINELDSPYKTIIRLVEIIDKLEA